MPERKRISASANGTVYTKDERLPVLLESYRGRRIGPAIRVGSEVLVTLTGRPRVHLLFPSGELYDASIERYFEPS